MSDYMNDKIMFSSDVMTFLRFGARSTFSEFLRKDKSFPQPFKIGGKNTWYREDVEAWLDKQREQANSL